MTENIRKPRREREATDDTDISTAPKAEIDDIDALLDEIDEVLEENAEEFVKNYVQKGGE